MWGPGEGKATAVDHVQAHNEIYLESTEVSTRSAKEENDFLIHHENLV